MLGKLFGFQEKEIETGLPKILQQNSSDCGPMICYHALFYTWVLKQGLFEGNPVSDKKLLSKIEALVGNSKPVAQKKFPKEGDLMRSHCRHACDFRLGRKHSWVNDLSLFE
jgi:hypothetical protein